MLAEHKNTLLLLKFFYKKETVFVFAIAIAVILCGYETVNLFNERLVI